VSICPIVAARKTAGMHSSEARIPIFVNVICPTFLRLERRFVVIVSIRARSEFGWHIETIGLVNERDEEEGEPETEETEYEIVFAAFYFRFLKRP
jgi:hypothetical protein